jgi:phosphate/sulfate permease
MKSRKARPISTIAGLAISLIGVLVEVWTAKSFMWGWHNTDFVVYAVPLALAVVCAYFTYFFYKRYVHNKPSELKLLGLVAILAVGGFIFNILLLVYVFSAMDFTYR